MPIIKGADVFQHQPLTKDPHKIRQTLTKFDYPYIFEIKASSR